MLHQLVEALKEELKKPLPGLEAQLTMAPDVGKNGKKYLNPGSDVRLGSVLILLYQDENGKIRFPMIERQVYEGVHSGQISLPGGKMEPGENFYQTALRETHEEIGIDPKSVNIIGVLSKFFIWVSNFHITPVVGFTEDKPEFAPDPYEVQRVIEVQLRNFLKKESIKKKNIHTALGHTIYSPYYDIEENVIWGATAMMLSEFFEIIRRTNLIR